MNSKHGIQLAGKPDSSSKGLWIPAAARKTGEASGEYRIEYRGEYHIEYRGANALMKPV